MECERSVSSVLQVVYQCLTLSGRLYLFVQWDPVPSLAGCLANEKAKTIDGEADKKTRSLAPWLWVVRMGTRHQSDSEDVELEPLLLVCLQLR